MFLLILLIIAVVIAFKLLGVMTRLWLKVFSFAVIGLLAIIIFAVILI